MLDNSVMSADDEVLLKKSINRAQNFLGIKGEPGTEELNLGELGNIDVKSYIKAIKSRKKS